MEKELGKLLQSRGFMIRYFNLSSGHKKQLNLGEQCIQRKDFGSTLSFLLLGWRKLFSIDCHLSRQYLLRFPQTAISQGAQAGKVIKFSMQAGSTISGANWCAQSISQAWPLERFQKERGTYFIHQSFDFFVGTASIAAVDFQASSPASSSWVSHLPTCIREPISFPWQCPHPAQCNSARALSLESSQADLVSKWWRFPSHPQVTCSANELWEGREPFSQRYLCRMILHVAMVPTAVSKLPPGFHKHHLYTNIIQSNSMAGKFSSVR